MVRSLFDESADDKVESVRRQEKMLQQQAELTNRQRLLTQLTDFERQLPQFPSGSPQRDALDQLYALANTAST